MKEIITKGDILANTNIDGDLQFADNVYKYIFTRCDGVEDWVSYELKNHTTIDKELFYHQIKLIYNQNQYHKALDEMKAFFNLAEHEGIRIALEKMKEYC